jgi:hypothetical protein
LVWAASPVEVTTDRTASYPTALDEFLPGAFHNLEKYANNWVEADQRRLKVRLRPMRGLKTDRDARVIVIGHAFIENLRRGHYQLGVDAAPKQQFNRRDRRARPGDLIPTGGKGKTVLVASASANTTAPVQTLPEPRKNSSRATFCQVAAVVRTLSISD